MLKTPVALFVFNRPSTTARVFQRISEVQPGILLLVADGPRPGHPEDAEKCKAVREIVTKINWPARVFENFSDVNMGCGRRVSSGLDWTFDQVEEAIVLEDDCLPSAGFFAYCEELLERYRSDTRIGIVSGNNFVYPAVNVDHSYYFSRYPHIWGWATWRRSWKKYDFLLSKLGLAEELETLNNIFYPEGNAAKYWLKRFAHAREVSDVWSYQLTFTSLSESWLNILPSRNLVANIGFAPGATHTQDADWWVAKLPAHEPDVPLRHPPFVVRNAVADERTDDHLFKIARRYGEQAAEAHRSRPPKLVRKLTKFFR